MSAATCAPIRGLGRRGSRARMRCTPGCRSGAGRPRAGMVSTRRTPCGPGAATSVTADPIAAVGPAQDTDWKLEPWRHAGELPAEAGALRRVLERSETTRLME